MKKKIRPSKLPVAPPKDPPKVLPRYPVYIPSKGRAALKMSTANCLIRDGVPFWLVVEPQELEEYAAHYPRERLIVTPFSNLGAPTTRNWIKDLSVSRGEVRHWQIDD